MVNTKTTILNSPCWGYMLARQVSINKKLTMLINFSGLHSSLMDVGHCCGRETGENMSVGIGYPYLLI